MKLTLRTGWRSANDHRDLIAFPADLRFQLDRTVKLWFENHKDELGSWVKVRPNVHEVIPIAHLGGAGAVP